MSSGRGRAHWRTGRFFYAYEWPTWAPAASMVPSPAVWPDGETDNAIKGMLSDAVTSAKLSHPGVRTSISTVDGGAALTLIDRSAEAGLVVLGSQGHSAVTQLPRPWSPAGRTSTRSSR